MKEKVKYNYKIIYTSSAERQYYNKIYTRINEKCDNFTRSFVNSGGFVAFVYNYVFSYVQAFYNYYIILNWSIIILLIVCALLCCVCFISHLLDIIIIIIIMIIMMIKLCEVSFAPR